MAYLFVGAGQAGCALVDSVFEVDRVSTLATPVAVNSTIRDLQNLSNVGQESWIGISQREGLVPGDEAGFEEKVSGGFGRDPKVADETASDLVSPLASAFAEQFGEGTPSFAFVFAGLGGGTGCGIAPHVAEAVTEFAGETTDVIAVAVLPNTSGDITRQNADDEETVSAGRQASNAVYGLDRLEDVVDGILLVDNQRLAYEEAAEGRFDDFNEYVAAGIRDLVSGPVLERIDPGAYEDFQPQTIDLQDVVTSLSVPDGTGYAAMGRSVVQTKSLPGYLVPFLGLGRQSVDGDTLAQLAISKRSVADLSPGLAKRAIGQIRAPAPYVTGDDYRIEISLVRSRLDSYCPEVNLGMMLTERNLASFTTLLTFEREDVDRIAQLESQAARHGPSTTV